VGAMLTATAGSVLVACGDTTGPDVLAIEVAGRLERSSVVALSARFEGTLLPDSAVTWTAEPAGAVAFFGGDSAALAQAGQVTFTAHAAVGTGSTTIPVATPPTIVFDLLRDGNRDIYRAALDGMDLVRLTTDPGDDGDPTAVGDRVVFVSYRDGNGELYAMPLEGGAPTRLTFTDAAEAGPALSSDGAWLAYTRSDGGVPKLWVSRSDGGAAARVTGSFGFPGSIEASPSWAPSGARLAFVSTAEGTADLFTYTVSTAAFAPLVPDSASRAEVEPAWSPDGAWVAFATDRPGDTEIYLLEVATGELRRLTNRPESDGQPTWVPDGRLVYVAWTGGSPRLRWLDPQVPNEVHDIDVGPGEPRHPAGVIPLPASR
jgi:Tol biopolymer transport system component